MSHTDPEILALTALGEQAGTAQDAEHLATCADCQLELERLTSLVAVGRGDGPVTLEQPPDRVWEQIAATVGQDGVARLPDETPQAEPAAPRPRDRRRRIGLAVAGIAAGLIIGIGGTAAVTELTKSPASQIGAQIQLSPLPQFPQWQGATGTAVLRQAQAAKQLAVSVSVPGRSGFYEVWLLGRNGTSMISLGDLDADHSGTFTLPTGVDLRFYSRIDVSLQPFNGSTQHSATSVVRGSLPSIATGAT